MDILTPRTRPLPKLGRERGQALIYGLFVLAGGLTALFFLFNTGQLVAEKSKLVNAADAVAYSAGVMHARALNFQAYTNRALIANEVMIAQAVSVSSWSSHVVTHTENVPMLNCRNQFAVPIALRLVKYTPVCFALTFGPIAAAVEPVDASVQVVAEGAVRASEGSKTLLQGAQLLMSTSFVAARQVLINQVADANYAGDGAVTVDILPLTDNYLRFEGQPFIRSYSGDDRQRFKDVAVSAAYRDDFIERRSWTDDSVVSCKIAPGARYQKRGGTDMIGFDQWKAMDTASLHPYHWSGIWPFGRCKNDAEIPLGYGTRAAAAGNAGGADDGNFGGVNDNPAARDLASGSDWGYSGLPTFYDLSQPGLRYRETDPDLERRNPSLRFAVSLTRDMAQLKTSAGTAVTKPTGSMDIFAGRLASNRMRAVATSEVYFRRPVARDDGKTELASLFNPYWQVRLVDSASADIALALIP